MHEQQMHHKHPVPQCGNGHRFVPIPHGAGVRLACLRCLTAALARGGAFRASTLGTLAHMLNAYEKDAFPRNESAEWVQATEAIIGWMNRRDEHYKGNLALGTPPGVAPKELVGRWIPADWTPVHDGEITAEIIRRAARHVAIACGLHLNQTATLPLGKFAELLDTIRSGFME